MKTLRFFALVVLVSAFTFPVKDVKLEYTFRNGDMYDYVQTSKQTIKQTIAGMGEVNTEIQLDATMQFKINEVTATGAKIEAQYLKLKAITNSSMVNMNMDSEGPDDNKQNQLLKSMMKKTFFFTLGKNGVVESVEGVENLYSGLNSLGLDETAVAAAKQAMRQTISEKSLKTGLEMGLVYYPDHKVKENDTWKRTSELVMNFALKIENVWGLKKLNGNLASVQCDGIMTTDDPKKVVPLPNGIKSKTDLTGRLAQFGTVNIATGWPTEMKAMSEIKGKMILLAGGMIPEDMDVPMEMLIESSFTITKK